MVFLEIPNVPKKTVFAEKVTYIEPVQPTYQNLLPYIEHVDDWKLLGTYLLPNEYTPRVINDNNRTHRGDVDECRHTLLLEYIKVGEVSWSKVINSLEKSCHSNVAKMIKRACTFNC